MSDRGRRPSLVAYSLGALVVCAVIGIPEAALLFGSRGAIIGAVLAVSVAVCVYALGTAIDWLYRREAQCPPSSPSTPSNTR